MTKEEIILKIRDQWQYMEGEDRSKTRIDRTGEVFTPDWLVDEMLGELPVEKFKEEIFVDTSCGDGQILAGVIIKKIENGLTIEQALESIRGVDFEESNVRLARERLSCGDAELYKILERNITQGDSLTSKIQKDLFVESD
jgi:hypothetical protein